MTNHSFIHKYSSAVMIITADTENIAIKELQQITHNPAEWRLDC